MYTCRCWANQYLGLLKYDRSSILCAEMRDFE
jgi:hypothetical protein